MGGAVAAVLTGGAIAAGVGREITAARREVAAWRTERDRYLALAFDAGQAKRDAEGCTKCRMAYRGSADAG